MKLYRYFLDGIPHYLARHYWWAYLWPPAIWFFDHQVVINAILFGQYNTLMAATMQRLACNQVSPILQLTCVYGSLTPNILNKISPLDLHITDVSQLQLNAARGKVMNKSRLLATRMNAERLAYKDNTFSTIVLFFLLHEMPSEARQRTLSECMRVLSSGGTFLLTEYAPLPSKHLLYRFFLNRFLLTRLEPYLASYWQDDLLVKLNDAGRQFGKCAEVVSHTLLFFRFYRVTEFRIVNVS